MLKIKNNENFKYIAGYFYSQLATTNHKVHVLLNIIKIIKEIDSQHKYQLYWIGLKHDLSKFGWYEISYYAKSIFDLRSYKYGSEEYIQM